MENDIEKSSPCEFCGTQQPCPEEGCGEYRRWLGKEQTASDLRSEIAFEITKHVKKSGLQTLHEVRAGIDTCPRCGYELFAELS